MGQAEGAGVGGGRHSARLRASLRTWGLFVVAYEAQPSKAMGMVPQAVAWD